MSLTHPDQDNGIYVRPQLHLAHDRFKQTENATEHLEDAPLLSRAWAFQERLLPTRTLHFHAEELVWECKSGVSCECGEIDSEQNQAVDTTSPKTGWLKKSLAIASRSESSMQSLGYIWLDIVSEFSRLRLTVEADRMPALSGLANSLSTTTLGSYLAGIWSNDIARDLLFERART